jgi:hypothetical protein
LSEVTPPPRVRRRTYGVLKGAISSSIAPIAATTHARWTTTHPEASEEELSSVTPRSVGRGIPRIAQSMPPRVLLTTRVTRSITAPGLDSANATSAYHVASSVDPIERDSGHICAASAGADPTVTACFNVGLATVENPAWFAEDRAARFPVVEWEGATFTCCGRVVRTFGGGNAAATIRPPQKRVLLTSYNARQLMRAAPIKTTTGTYFVSHSDQKTTECEMCSRRVSWSPPVSAKHWPACGVASV